MTIEPITPEQWVATCDQIANLWLNDRNWTGATAAALYDRFNLYPHDVITAAVNRLFNEGSQTAPKPSKLMAAVRAIAAERYGATNLPEDPTTTGPCPHHATGVESYWGGDPEHEAAIRCAACGTEWTKAPPPTITRPPCPTAAPDETGRYVNCDGCHRHPYPAKWATTEQLNGGMTDRIAP